MSCIDQKLPGFELTRNTWTTLNRIRTSSGRCADSLYGWGKARTPEYINAAPQWQSFNGGNWNRVERSSRNYADKRKANLQVWTGTYGIATLPHESTQKPTELYLYVNQRTRALPVPALYWKIVYNPSNKRCVVLIGLNNPFEENVSKYIICRDISNSLNWLSWQKNVLENSAVLIIKITYNNPQYGLNINEKKIKSIVISRNTITEGQLYVNHTPIERVRHYNYLGAIIYIKHGPIIRRQEQASKKSRLTFNRMGAFCSVYFYVVESWTLNEDPWRRFEGDEIRLYLRILEIPWTNEVTNEEVLREMKKKTERY
ncbi:unnamed protein product [Diabrotica balteata]|uniref:DNA/RNA non-specific endonuclease/pyrophosphatase/phosphodiesterase domain-containing protein n=1 Tax=Diabrotica balteata TaxID=107213 RepID=A0A9N9SUN2_DIABA|nr:unnamed protein product [Diabrotica balteata]